MPGFEDKLSELQRWQAVDYIRGFVHPPAAAASAPAGALPVSPDPFFSPAYFTFARALETSLMSGTVGMS